MLEDLSFEPRGQSYAPLRRAAESPEASLLLRTSADGVGVPHDMSGICKLLGAESYILHSPLQQDPHHVRFRA
eukprot:4985-Eustigmatos_ZCMA.PRE.1